MRSVILVVTLALTLALTVATGHEQSQAHKPTTSARRRRGDVT